jgi:hypothetical protein
MKSESDNVSVSRVKTRILDRLKVAKMQDWLAVSSRFLGFKQNLPRLNGAKPFGIAVTKYGSEYTSSSKKKRNTCGSNLPQLETLKTS